jgi:hypothetical protein
MATLSVCFNFTTSYPVGNHPNNAAGDIINNAPLFKLKSAYWPAAYYIINMGSLLNIDYGMYQIYRGGSVVVTGMDSKYTYLVQQDNLNVGCGGFGVTYITGG